MEENKDWKSSKEIRGILLPLGIMVITVLILSPFIIEIKHSNWLNAGEILSFYGAIIGATVAIVGVYWTLKQSQKSLDVQLRKSEELSEAQLRKSEEINQEIIRDNKERFAIERKQRIFPFLVISEDRNILNYNNINSLFSENYFVDAVSQSYKDFLTEKINNFLEHFNNINNYVVFWLDGKTRCGRNYFDSCEMEQIIGFFEEDISSEPSCSYFFASFTLSNVGIATARDIEIAIFQDDDNIDVFDLVKLIPNEEFKLVFYYEDFVGFDVLKYQIQIKYYDIDLEEEHHKLYELKISSNYCYSQFYPIEE